MFIQLAFLFALFSCNKNDERLNANLPVSTSNIGLKQSQTFTISAEESGLFA